MDNNSSFLYADNKYFIYLLLPLRRNKLELAHHNKLELAQHNKLKRKRINIYKGIMPTLQEKLSESLEVLRKIQSDEGISAIKATGISRTHRERLLENGFIREVMKG